MRQKSTNGFNNLKKRNVNQKEEKLEVDCQIRILKEDRKVLQLKPRTY
jgi:hypothetical protein